MIYYFPWPGLGSKAFTVDVTTRRILVRPPITGSPEYAKEEVQRIVEFVRRSFQEEGWELSEPYEDGKNHWGSTIP